MDDLEPGLEVFVNIYFVWSFGDSQASMEMEF